MVRTRCRSGAVPPESASTVDPDFEAKVFSVLLRLTFNIVSPYKNTHALSSCPVSLARNSKSKDLSNAHANPRPMVSPFHLRTLPAEGHSFRRSLSRPDQAEGNVRCPVFKLFSHGIV